MPRPSSARALSIIIIVSASACASPISVGRVEGQGSSRTLRVCEVALGASAEEVSRHCGEPDATVAWDTAPTGECLLFRNHLLQGPPVLAACFERRVIEERDRQSARVRAVYELGPAALSGGSSASVLDVLRDVLRSVGGGSDGQ